MNAMDTLIIRLLNKEANTRPQLIKRVGIGTPRTTVYDSLKRLMTRGLVVAEKEELSTGEERKVGRPMTVFK